MQEALLREFEPVVSIEIKDIGQGRTSEVVLEDVFLALVRKHRTLVDKENSVVYIGR